MNKINDLVQQSTYKMKKLVCGWNPLKKYIIMEIFLNRKDVGHVYFFFIS